VGKLEALRPLVGRWSTRITLLYPMNMKGRQFEAEDTYRWLGEENILIHEVTGEMNGKPLRSIEIYSGGSNRQFRARSFDDGGEVSDFRASMKKGEWKIVGNTQRFTSSKLTDDLIEGVWQLKSRGKWRDWMMVSLSRLA
jgi:hypothetical protein